MDVLWAAWLRRRRAVISRRRPIIGGAPCLAIGGATDAALGHRAPAKLISRGNSNGGLLVAVAAMQAPEAFGAVFCRAPILDMLLFPEFGHLGGATTEYGSPDDPVEGAHLAGYSPYHNVRADRRYPAMAFVSALNDQTAPPHDPLKMVARL